jgi:hypothetical protein
MVATLITPLVVLSLMQWLERSYELALGDDRLDSREAYGLVVGLVAAATTAFVAMGRFSEAAAHVGAAARRDLCSRAYLQAIGSSAASHGDHSVSAATAAFFVQSAALAPLFEGLVALMIQPVEIVGILAVLARVVGLFPALAAIATASIGLSIARVSIGSKRARWIWPLRRSSEASCCEKS